MTSSASFERPGGECSSGEEELFDFLSIKDKPLFPHGGWAATYIGLCSHTTKKQAERMQLCEKTEE
jgi:hypothetical protein